MPKRIIVIRHGETDYNLKGIAQGWSDEMLNSDGVKQAEKLAEKLKDELIDVIYSSDLKRALHTALPLAGLKKLKVKTTRHLRERMMGVFQHKSWDDIRKLYPGMLEKLDDITDLDWKENQGESYREVKDRAQRILDEIFLIHKNKSVALVTHGGMKRTLLRLLGHEDLANERPKNTSVTVLEKDGDGKYQVKVFNDARHLENEE